MDILTLAALLIMAGGFRRLFMVWRQGRSLDRYDRPVERLARSIAEVTTQRRVLRLGAAGLLHSGLFWGFLLLLAGTCLVMLQADVVGPLLGRNFLVGSFYQWFSLLLDLAGLAAMAALLLMAARRFVLRPEGISRTPEDALLHLLLLVIIMTGFLIEGCRMAVTELSADPGLARWSPVGLLVARTLMSFGSESLIGLHRFLWWLHLLLGLGFVALIPYTRLRHLVTAAANSYFENLDSRCAIPELDLEDASQVSFGAATVADFSWKDLYDADACTLCNRCQERCPAFICGKPLSPVQVVRQIGQIAREEPGAALADRITREALWACLTCGACQEVCPSTIEHVGKIVQMRRALVLMSGEFADAASRKAVEAIETNGNPFGMARAARGAWAAGLPVDIVSSGGKVDLLYFVGCQAAYDPRNRKVAESFVRLCASAGLRVTILGSGEYCCGEPLRMLGNEYLFQETARKNIEAFRRHDVKRIVTACPHCSRTIGSVYRDLGYTVPVEHHTVALARMASEGRLSFATNPFELTFHDPCNLGRCAGVFREPRELLRRTGGTLREMSLSGRDGFCCGGGGGRFFAEDRSGRRVNVDRVGMASRTGASLLVTACPFCLSMLEDAVPSLPSAGKLRVLDVAELAASRLAGRQS